MYLVLDLYNNTAHTTTIAPTAYGNVHLYPNTRYERTPLTMILAPFIRSLMMLSKYFITNPMISPRDTDVATIIHVHPLNPVSNGVPNSFPPIQ